MTDSTKRLAQQYCSLKKFRDGLDKRLEELSKQLKAELDEGTYELEDAKLSVQVRNRTEFNEDAAWDLVESRPELYEMLVDNFINKSFVEQAYLAGHISDAELRELRKPQYSVALVVESV